MAKIILYCRLFRLLSGLIWHIYCFSFVLVFSHINKEKIAQLGILLASLVLAFSTIQVWLNKQEPRLELRTTNIEVAKNIKELLSTKRMTQKQLQQLIKEYKQAEKTGVKSRNLYYNLAVLETATSNDIQARNFLNQSLELEPNLLDLQQTN